MPRWPWQADPMTAPRIVATHPRSDLLPALRELLAAADEAVLATAFVDTRGIHLLGRELRELGPQCRLLATTVFGGARAHAAFATAQDLGTRCRVFNPPRGTFHPKVVVARHGRTTRAMIGSANLTAGLVANIEAGLIVEGAAATEASELVETWWSDRAAAEWARPDTPVRDVLDASLWDLIRARVRPGDVLTTLSGGKPNRVTEVTRAGLWVETERSRAARSGPQHVEPWMIDVAWAALVTDGELTNQRLLEDLRVHRSSFVCALLARLPGVRIARRRPIHLVLDHVEARPRLDEAALAAETRVPFQSDVGE